MTTIQPLNEEARISSLRALHILDTPPEEAFDRITRLVRHIFGAPMATISFVDQDRQWSKSRLGLTDCQTARSVSFSTHTILNRDVLVVPDAWNDPRFSGSPLVTGDPHIRFYAGAPLRSRDGHNLGALSIMDTAARPDLDGHQRAILADLAEMVVEACTARLREQELLSAKEHADGANRSKSEFLSRASHELRTPLNSVLGFTQLLEMDDLTEVQCSNVHRILKAAKHLLKLVNEVLEISRIEAGGLAVELEPVIVAEAIREAAEFMEPLLRENGIRLRVDSSPSAGYTLLADHQKLIQVFLNLLSNAIKYNRPNGEIVVSQELIGSDQLRIKVADTGNGITAENQRKLFQPFERLGADRTKIVGTGLGLALSKKMVELMGGSIGVESVPGAGTTFWLQFGLFEGEPRASVAEKPEQIIDAGPTVLYIEDAIVSIHLIKGILKRARLKNGATVRLISAMQGNLGLEMARIHAPQLILLDLHLPDLSGIQVLNRLKSDPRTSSIPVVVLTADALPGTRSQVIEAGALACHSKPVEVAQFLETVSQILEESTCSSSNC